MDDSLKPRDQLLQELARLRQRVAELESGEQKRQLVARSLARAQDAVKCPVNEQAGQLQDSEARFQTLVEGSLQGILIHRDFKPLFVNQAYADIFGYDSPAEILQSENILHLVAAQHEHERLSHYGVTRLDAGGAPARYEYQGIRRDGERVWILNFVSLTTWDQAPAIHTTSIDITAHKQAQEAQQQINQSLEQEVLARTVELTTANHKLRQAMSKTERVQKTLLEREQRFRDLVEGSIQGVMIHRHYKILFVNRAYAELFGYASPAEFAQIRDLRLTVAPDDRERLEDDMEKRQRGEAAPSQYEYQGIRQNGTLIWVSHTVRVVRWEGEPAIQSTIVDITARQQAEAALLVSEARFRAAFETAAIGMVQATLNGRMMTTNQAFQRMLGYSSDELHGMLIEEITHPEDAALHLDFFGDARAGVRDSYESEKRYCCKDGKVIWGHVTVSLVRDDAGKPAFTIGLVVDITERKRLDAQLRQSERLGSLGTFAAGMAHELNNPLAAIRITAEHARDALGIGPEQRVVHECLTEVLDDAQRCAQIVKRVLHFAQPANRVKSQVALHPLIRVAQTHTQRYVEQKGGRVNLTFASEQPTIIAHEDEIELVLINLIRNAVEASRPGGSIAIRTEMCDREVQVAVQDFGIGLSEPEQQRVFDPFYTTRETSGGTGLGLSIVHRIITDHNGRIALASRPGQGTTVQFQ
ncbi:MAG: PAS domain S-box protein [Candidatus Tectomicrobia bacterium]|nr:PAS domain S-box protein [Candidatus Tectomicrobia bacterium]